MFGRPSIDTYKQIWLSLFVSTSCMTWPFLLRVMLVAHGSWICFFFVCPYHHRLLAHSLLLYTEKTLCISVNDCVVVSLKPVLFTCLPLAQAACTAPVDMYPRYG